MNPKEEFSEPPLAFVYGTHLCLELMLISSFLPTMAVPLLQFCKLGIAGLLENNK